MEDIARIEQKRMALKEKELIKAQAEQKRGSDRRLQLEDEKRNNPPIKRVTRSQTASEQDDNKRSFSAVTKTRQALNPTQNETVKPLDIQPIKAMTYEEKSLVLLTEVRDLLKVIAAKK